MVWTIHALTTAEKDWALEIVRRNWGADFVVTRGRQVFPAEIEGIYALDDRGESVGLATYEIRDDECEVITLDALRKFCGIGTALLSHVRGIARRRGCHRLWLITTNDNLDAIRFYQRRGLVMAAVHVNALAISRQMKPSIPELGAYGIPPRDEIEFEERW